MNSEEEIELKESERTRCEIYSRVVGYLRMVDSWNDGKQQEFRDRKLFDKSVGRL